MACMCEWLGQRRCFGKSHELPLRGTEGLELRLASRWNEGVSHYDGSETGKGIRNVQGVKN